MEAFVEAKKAGKLRYIGFTGHKDPRIHLQMLEVAAERGFHFDTGADAAQRDGRAFPLASRHLVLPYLVAARHRRARHEDASATACC